MTHRGYTLWASLALALAASGCTSGTSAGQGVERGACYPNGTCNAGLTCLSNVCVSTQTGDAGADARTDAAVSDAVTGDAAPTPDADPGDATALDVALTDAAPPDVAPADTAPADSSVPDAAVVPDANVADARSDVQRIDDGGIPCPGAVIYHPGMETRMVGTSVPFSGRGRGTSCEVLTGGALVWRDSLEGMIGTGETFNHTFTMLGTHTVTLTATYSGGTSTASITFMITLTGT